MLDTPVLFLVFNRPDLTKRVFETIKEAKPKQLFIAADGPRLDNDEDFEKCNQVREIIKQIDWDCDLSTLFQNSNMGCKVAVSSAIDWFFENVDEGIILEDDTLPDQSFFQFCQENLEKYRFDSRIMQICGSNYHIEWKIDNDSYFFSKFGPIWGWASWKRAWKYYDVDVTAWPEIKNRKLHFSFCDTKDELEWREILFDNLYNNKIDTWDYQWVFAKLINSGLNIIPVVNLISNIGFRQDATHTIHEGITSNLPIKSFIFPMNHSVYIIRNKLADDKYFQQFVSYKARNKELKIPHKNKLFKDLYQNIILILKIWKR